VVLDPEDDREGDGQRTSLTGPVYKPTQQSGSQKTGTDGIMLCSPPTRLDDDSGRRRRWLDVQLENRALSIAGTVDRHLKVTQGYQH